MSGERNAPATGSDGRSAATSTEWHHIEGSLHFANLVLASDGEARVVVLRSRKELDTFLASERIGAQDISWDRP